MIKHRFNKMPEMRAEDYAALLDNLRQFGYDENYPVVFYENDILDGWNRFRASQELGIKYAEKYFIGTYEEAVEFVHRTNTRRNLTVNEQAELIGRYYEDIKAARGGDRKSAEFQKSKSQTDTLILDEAFIETPAYEMDEFSQVPPPRPQGAKKKAAHTYGVSEATVMRKSEYVKALDVVPEDVRDEARAGRISQTEVVRIAKGEERTERPKFDKKEMKRLVGAIAFEVEALADTFPDTREVCDRVLNLCRNAQEYTGV